MCRIKVIIPYFEGEIREQWYRSTTGFQAPTLRFLCLANSVQPLVGNLDLSAVLIRWRGGQGRRERSLLDRRISGECDPNLPVCAACIFAEVVRAGEGWLPVGVLTADSHEQFPSGPLHHGSVNPCFAGGVYREQATAGVDPGDFAGIDQSRDFIVQARTPVEKVLPVDTGDAGVSQNIGVALLDFPVVCKAVR